MLERRKHQRSRAFQAGSFAQPGQRAESDVVVRDLSAGGALLLLAEPGRAPSDIELNMPGGAGRRRAKVVWRSEAAMGVAFAPEAALRPAPPSSTVVSFEAARRERQMNPTEDRFADRIARATRPRAGAMPFWARPDAEQ